MTNWMIVNKHRIRGGQFASSNEDGFNGAFEFAIPGEARRVFVIASDGFGWRHVSVSFGRNLNPPSWDVMSQIKDWFFGKDEWVVQFHPPETEYVNNHPGCLHLWQPTDGKFPTPNKLLVGIKELGTLK